MKIGIISDIHAQSESSTKALAIFNDQSVDHLVCAGDLVEKGDDGDTVIRMMIQHKIPCVRGNHDEAAVSNQRWFRRSMNRMYVEETIARLNRGEVLQTKLLSDRALLYLQNLPFKRSFEWAGIRVLLVHGSPGSNSQYLMPAMPGRQLKSFLQNTEEDIIICGHTHSPMYRVLDDQLLLNPGSVCASLHNRESNTCAILTLPQKKFELFSLMTGEKFILS